MKPGWQPGKWLEKKAKRGVRGYPVGSVAFYGPDRLRATKVAVGILPGPESDPAELRRWFAETGDVRADEAVLAEIVRFLREQQVYSVVMTDGIFGCPHEEGTDYPEGTACPHCPYWAGRDRRTGVFGAT